MDGTHFYPQIVLPRVFRPDIMRQMHEGGLVDILEWSTL